MLAVTYFSDDDGSVPVKDYIASLDHDGRSGEAARMLRDIDLLAEHGMAGAQQLGTRFSRIIDRNLRIWELRPGPHRIAYAAIRNELVLLYAWRKTQARLDPQALRRAQRNYQREVGRTGPFPP